MKATQSETATKFTFLLYLLLAFFLTLLSCSKEPTTLKVATASNTISEQETVATLKKLIEADSSFNISIQKEFWSPKGERYSLSSLSSSILLSAKSVDLAIVQTDFILQPTKFTDSLKNHKRVKTVLPLYPEVFLIFYRSDTLVTSFDQLLRDKRLIIGPKESGSAIISKRLFSHFGIQSSQYKPYYNNFGNCRLNDTTDVICLMTRVDDPCIKVLLQRGYALFQLHDYTPAVTAGPLQGFIKQNQNIRPFTIPANYFPQQKDHRPYKTFAVDPLLICREDLPDLVIYDLVSTIKENLFRNKGDEEIPFLLSAYSSKEDCSHYLQFPLHEGSSRYLTQKEPTRLERHANAIRLGFLLVALFILFVIIVKRWQIHLRKERIDALYFEALDIKKDVGKEKSFTKLLNLKQQLVKLENRSYQLLTREKLAADESFSILTKMLSEIETHLREKLE